MFSRWKRRPDAERGMADEIGFHLEARTEDLMRSGLSRAEAMRRAINDAEPADREIADALTDVLERMALGMARE